MLSTSYSLISLGPEPELTLRKHFTNLRDRDQGFKIKLDDVLKHVLSQL